MSQRLSCQLCLSRQFQLNCMPLLSWKSSDGRSECAVSVNIVAAVRNSERRYAKLVTSKTLLLNSGYFRELGTHRSS